MNGARMIRQCLERAHLPVAEHAFDQEGRIAWLEHADKSRMPFDPLLWRDSPLKSTFPACMATGQKSSSSSRTRIPAAPSKIASVYR